MLTPAACPHRPASPTYTPPEQAFRARASRERAWTHATHRPTSASPQLTPPKRPHRLPTNCGTRVAVAGRRGRRPVRGLVCLVVCSSGPARLRRARAGILRSVVVSRRFRGVRRRVVSACCAAAARGRRVVGWPGAGVLPSPGGERADLSGALSAWWFVPLTRLVSGGLAPGSSGRWSALSAQNKSSPGSSAAWRIQWRSRSSSISSCWPMSV